MPYWILILIAIAVPAQRVPPIPACSCSDEARTHAQQGFEAHSLRRLTEASAAYSRALAAQPAADPNPEERALILRFAPRLFTHAQEPFPLKDAAAILHPDKPFIAYHFFWEDDIDFPDDNDPCDHELIWVELNPDRTRAVNYYLYFHGRILKAPPKAIQDMTAHQGRPAVLVQWGKHGSLPFGWESLPITADRQDLESTLERRPQTLTDYQRATWQKLHTEGRSAPGSRLARNWPLKFEGTWESFRLLDRELDLRPYLTANIAVSALNSAVINRWFLRYNFSAKTEWPPQICDSPSR